MQRNKIVTATIEEYTWAGLCAFHYPRKKLVSINGFPAIPEMEAVAKMRANLKRFAKEERATIQANSHDHTTTISIPRNNNGPIFSQARTKLNGSVTSNRQATKGEAEPAF